MRPSEQRALWAGAFALALATAVGVRADEPVFRYSAPIEIRQPAPFVQLALPPSAYAHVVQPGLRDLRVVDARGERAPHSLLGARSEQQTTEHTRPAVLYPLPARPAADGAWASPVEVVVDGDRIQVRKRGGTANSPGVADARRSGGWLVDLGEHKAGDPLPKWLRLQWSGPAEFTAGYRVDRSDDLRSWRSGGAGQLMALTSAAGPLTQPSVGLADGTGRFVRLVWNDAAAAPQVTGARVVAVERTAVAIDAPTDLVLAPVAPPTDAATVPEQARGALYFDFEGALPLDTLELRFASGTRVAPVRLQGRQRPDEPWRDLGQGVFYRLERDGSVNTSPALSVRQTVRFVRVIPDERAAPLDAGTTRLAVQAQLARLVFAAQGQPPFRLLAGSKDAPGGALPAETLVPALTEERARFGQAGLGAWRENEEAARRLEAEQREAKWRPLLLWSVLVAGVAALGFMVWGLARGTPAKPVANAGPLEAGETGAAPR
jgi:hypothetical protein